MDLLHVIYIFVCLYEFMDLWIYGYMDLWIYGFMDNIWIYRILILFGFTDL